MNITFLHPTYLQIYELCGQLAKNIISKRKFNFDYIVAVTPKGLVPAMILSSFLRNIPVVPVVFNSMFGLNNKKPNQFIDINKEVNYGTLTEIITTTILIVDGICDTGKTISTVSEFYKNTNHEVYSCSLYYRPKENTVFSPTFFGQKVNEGTIIDFPWGNDS